MPSAWAASRSASLAATISASDCSSAWATASSAWFLSSVPSTPSRAAALRVFIAMSWSVVIASPPKGRKRGKTEAPTSIAGPLPGGARGGVRSKPMVS